MRLTAEGPLGLKQRDTVWDPKSSEEERALEHRRIELMTQVAAERYLSLFGGRPMHPDFPQALRTEFEVVYPWGHFVTQEEIQTYAPELFDEWDAASSAMREAWVPTIHPEEILIPSAQEVVDTGRLIATTHRIEQEVKARKYPDKEAAVARFAEARMGHPPIYEFLNGLWGENHPDYSDQTYCLVLGKVDELLRKSGQSLQLVLSANQRSPLPRALVAGVPGMQAHRHALMARILQGSLDLAPGHNMSDVEAATHEWIGALDGLELRVLMAVLTLMNGTQGNDGRNIKASQTPLVKFKDFKELCGETSRSSENAYRILRAIDSLSDRTVSLNVTATFTGKDKNGKPVRAQRAANFEEQVIKRSYSFEDPADSKAYSVHRNTPGSKYKGSQPTHVTFYDLHRSLAVVENSFWAAPDLLKRCQKAARAVGLRDGDFTTRLLIVITAHTQRHITAPNGAPYCYLNREEFLNDFHGADKVEALRKKEGPMHRYVAQYLKAIEGLQLEGLLDIVELEYQGTTGVRDRFTLPQQGGGIHDSFKDPDQLALSGMTNEPRKKAKKKKKKQ